MNLNGVSQYTEKADSGSVLKDRRARPVRNGVRRYPAGAPNGAAAPWEPPRSPIIQAAHDRYAAHGPRVNPLLLERRRGGFLEPKEGEFGVFEGVWISGPKKPPSSEDLRSSRCASAATTDRRSAGVKGDASAFASLGSSVSAANPAFTAKSPVPNGEDSIVSFTLEGE